MTGAPRDPSSNPRTALVLSGGGARGAYQAGVLRGLVDLGVLGADRSGVDIRRSREVDLDEVPGQRADPSARRPTAEHDRVQDRVDEPSALATSRRGCRCARWVSVARTSRPTMTSEP